MAWNSIPLGGYVQNFVCTTFLRSPLSPPPQTLRGGYISCSTPSCVFECNQLFVARPAKGVLICGTQYVGVGRCNNSWSPPPPNGALCKINDRGVVCFEGDKLGSADSAYIRNSPSACLPRGVINLLASVPSLCAAENNVRGATRSLANKNVCSPEK
jgi:hypothetical protein